MKKIKYILLITIVVIVPIITMHFVRNTPQTQTSPLSQPNNISQTKHSSNSSTNKENSTPSTKTKYYQNGEPVSPKTVNFNKDIKKVIKKTNEQILFNYPLGYKLKFPKDMKFNFKYSPAFTRIYNDHLNIKISKEHCPYEPDYKENINDEVSGIEMYFKKYLNNFILDSKYRKANSITLVDNKWKYINNYKTKILSFYRTPAKGSKQTQNCYVFAYMITDKQQFYNFFFRTDSLNKYKPTINNILNSFKKIELKGTTSYNTDFKPILPNWNKETLNFYNKLKNSNDIMWGFFTLGHSQKITQR